MGGGWGRVLHLLGSPTGYERGEGKRISYIAYS